jgi:IS4 transposase
MNILPSIEKIFKSYFGEFFETIPEFFLKNFLILVQGILSKKHSSISDIARDPLNNRAHTTLTRFLKSHNEFWNEMKIIMKEKVNACCTDKRVFVIDDTLVERRGKQIPFVSKRFNHCTGQYTQGQIILTVGAILQRVFQPLEMLFTAGSEEKDKSADSKNEMAVCWLKANKVSDAVVIGDSWYTNAYIIESCHFWFKSTFIGQLKGGIILKTAGKQVKVKTLISSAKLKRSVKVKDKMIRYCSFDAEAPSIRIGVKVVVTELEDGSRAALLCSDTNLSSEQIIEYYSLRWCIESFFKMAKQDFSFAKCHVRSQDAQNHYMILISIAYLIFNDLKKLICVFQKNVSNHQIFSAFNDALSTMFVIL